ncbi:hypothetical protein SAMN02799627_04965 [Methylobacterium sp. 13MFTsu3.1M2]|nr:hypothetical protein SAMN02799627_04965 [Methylobacterium sp. 13MFTsu3.1M2]
MADQIEAVEEPVHDGGFQDERAGPDLDQKVLGRVDQMGQRRDLEQAGRALEGVHRPEDVVEGLGARRLLQGQHAAPRALQELAGLGNELGEQGVGHGAAPAITVATATRASGRTGLTR